MFNFLGRLTMLTIKVSAAIVMGTIAAVIGAVTFLGYKLMSNKNASAINVNGRKEVKGESYDRK